MKKKSHLETFLLLSSGISFLPIFFFMLSTALPKLAKIHVLFEERTWMFFLCGSAVFFTIKRYACKKNKRCFLNQDLLLEDLKTIPSPRKIFVVFFLLSQFFLLLSSALTKYYAYHTSASDMSIFDAMMYNTLHGHFMFDHLINGINHFGVHQNYILFFILPFYALFHSQLFLVILSPILVFSAIRPVFLLAQDATKSPFLSWLCVFFYLKCTLTMQAFNFDFRPELFFPVVFFYFILFQFRKSFLRYIFAFLFLLIKEDASIYLLLISVSSFLFSKTRYKIISSYQDQLVYILASLIFYGVNSQYMVPYFLGQQSPFYMHFWAHLGSNPSEIIKNTFARPLENIIYFLHAKWVHLFYAFFLVPLFNPCIFLATLPVIAIFGLASKESSLFDFSHYYPLMLSCMYFLCVLFLLKSFLEGKRFFLFQYINVFYLFFIGILVGFGYVTLYPVDLKFHRNFEEVNHYFMVKNQDQTLGKNTKICFQFIFTPHVDYGLYPLLKPFFLDTSRCDYLIISQDKNPYPYQKSDVEDFIKTMHLEKKFGEIGIYKK